MSAAATRDRAEAQLASVLAPYLADPALLHLALAHRSFCAENPNEESNERLEFLGDAVLGLVVTDHLYRSLAGRSEGDLARIRAAVVSTDALAPIAAALGAGEALLLGRGEEASGGRQKASLLADALEALIGAAYLSSGAEAAAGLVHRLLDELIETEAERADLGDAKNRLQELAARLALAAPQYVTTGRGPDHDRRFSSVASVGQVETTGEGRSKKSAERLAAQAAIDALDLEPSSPETMPELPEVETVRLGVERALVGCAIEKVVVSGRRSVRRQAIPDFVLALEGHKITAARRRGKYLLLDLDDEAVLVIHLRMSGQLLHVRASEPLALHTHIVFVLDDASELRFVDPRTFGEMFVARDLDERAAPLELQTIGRDPLVDGIDPRVLAARLSHRRIALKAFLLDQRELAGIGNIYGDEICFTAKLAPTRRTDTLGKSDVRRLCQAIDAVLKEAVAAGGSSLRDARYRDLFGGLGSFQSRHAVYDRAGEPCIRCPGIIRRQRVAGRSSYSCPRCQR